MVSNNVVLVLFRLWFQLRFWTCFGCGFGCDSGLGSDVVLSVVLTFVCMRSRLGSSVNLVAVLVLDRISF